MPQVTQYPRMPRWEYWHYIPPILFTDAPHNPPPENWDKVFHPIVSEKPNIEIPSELPSGPSNIDMVTGETIPEHRARPPRHHGAPQGDAIKGGKGSVDLKPKSTF